MTLGIIKRTTPNFSFRIPFFDGPNWGRELERNFDTIDAVLFAATGFTNVKGVWTNDTEYDAGDRVVDPADGTTWQANVTHTSAATGSFEDDRVANPSFWTQLSSTVGFRGQWTTTTNYNVNEFLYDDHRYGAVMSKYTSGASYNADVAAGKILTLIDLKSAYDTTAANAAAAATSAANALTSENNADASEAAALVSKNAAATSAANALTSENNADASEAAALASQNAAAQSALDAAAFGVVTSLFNFSTTVSYPPSTGQVRLNNATQNSATRIDVAHVNAGGVDLTHIMPDLVQAGTIIILQDKATIGNWKSYTATGPATLSGSDFQIPVVFRSGGGDIANNRPTQIAFAGGGGSASVTTDDNPPAGPLRDGQLWFKASTGVFYVYYDDGNTQQWVQIGSGPQPATGPLSGVVSINGGPMAEYRNKIINGGMQTKQRPSASFTATGYTLDRWRLVLGTSAACTITQQKNTIAQDDTNGYSLTWARGTVGSTPSTLGQRIEDVRTLAGKTVTVTFEAYALAATDIAVGFVQSFGTGGSPSADVNIAEQTIAIGTTKQRFSRTFAIPSIAGKVLGSGGNDFLNMYFSRAIGSANPTTTIIISRVSVVEGDATQEADPFSARNIATEQELCDRYYQFTNSILFGGYGAAGATLFMTMIRRVRMRAAPATAAINISGVSNVTTLVLSNNSLDAAGFSVTVVATGTGSLSFDVTGDAEL